MKIIHILFGKANPNTMNGVNKVVHHIATEQQRLGLDVEVWGITATPTKIRHEHDYPLKLFPVHRLRLVPSGELRKAVNKLPGHTIVHLHSVFVPEFYVVSRLLRRKQISWVLTPHGGYEPASLKRNRFMKIIYMKLLECGLIKQAKAIHATGASEERNLQEIVSSKKLVLIPNGQDLGELQYSELKIEIAPRPIFGYCGRLDAEHKGLDLLLKGFKYYTENGGKGTLWLIGDGVDRHALESQAAKLVLSNRVRFFGTIYGGEKLNRISHMDIFVHTSRWDGMPMAALEAAGLAKPLLVSTATNFGPFVTKYGSGVVLPDNSPQCIGSAMLEIEKIYLAGGLGEMGKRAFEMVTNELTWKQAVEQISRNLYN